MMRREEDLKKNNRKASQDRKNHANSVKELKKVIDDERKEVISLHFQAYELDSQFQGYEAIHRKLNLVNKLKDKVECPVCLEIPWTGPVPVCPNGHLVRQDCKRDTCPTCRVQMGNGHSLLVVTILENIDHKCKFDECDDYFPVDKVKDLIKVCSHRTVTGPYGHCKVKQVSLSK